MPPNWTETQPFGLAELEETLSWNVFVGLAALNGPAWPMLIAEAFLTLQNRPNGAS
jgi:hypothetical protein